MYMSLTEEVFLKLNFQLFLSTVFICSTHSVEMHGKDGRPERTVVLKFCQCAFIIYGKLCVDIS